MVVVWSEASIKSQWVQEEAIEAKRRRVIFPVRIDDVQPPFGFRTIQAADMTSEREADRPAVLEALIKELATVLEPPPAVVAREEAGRKEEAEGGAQHKADAERRLEEQAERKAEGERQQQTDLERQRESAELERRRHLEHGRPNSASRPEPVVATRSSFLSKQTRERWRLLAIGIPVIVVTIIVVVIVSNGDPDPRVPPPSDPHALAGHEQPSASSGHNEAQPIETEDAFPSCPSGMVYIRGGSFDGGDEERHIKGFCMDIGEVTVEAYRGCVERGECTEPDQGTYCNWGREGREPHPINCVRWDQATAFCRFMDKQLPNEWEWGWAARGREQGRTYPWGEEPPSCELAVMDEGGDGCGQDSTWPVGSRPRGKSRDGLVDMAGNVSEWTSSSDGNMRVVRGGSWISFIPDYFRASYSVSNLPSYRYFHLGFRCARTAGRFK